MSRDKSNFWPTFSEVSDVQSRPQSSIKHKNKGWHALQQNGSDKPARSLNGSTSPAVYVRPDRTVQADMSADSFPSLAGPTSNPAVQSSASAFSITQHQAATPERKSRASSANSTHHPAQRQRPQYATALSPEKLHRHADRPRQDDMALTDAELAAITQLLSLHTWAEPGLARVRPIC